MNKVVRMFHCGTALDELLSFRQGLPRKVNYMIIGNPGVGKTSIILDMLANMQNRYPSAQIICNRTVYAMLYHNMRHIDITFAINFHELIEYENN